MIHIASRVKALRALAGDALVAIGEAVRGGSATLSVTTPVASIPSGEIRSALDELDDSQLLNVAALIIAGWKPLLLKTAGDLTDVDVLVEALCDRASQFAAFKDVAERPFNADDLSGAYLTPSPRRGE